MFLSKKNQEFKSIFVQNRLTVSRTPGKEKEQSLHLMFSLSEFIVMLISFLVSWRFFMFFEFLTVNDQDRAIGYAKFESRWNTRIETGTENRYSNRLERAIYGLPDVSWLQQRYGIHLKRLLVCFGRISENGQFEVVPMRGPVASPLSLCTPSPNWTPQS